MKLRVLLLVFVGLVLGCSSNRILLAQEDEAGPERDQDRKRVEIRQEYVVRHESRERDEERRENGEHRRPMVRRERGPQTHDTQRENVERRLHELRRLGMYDEAERLEEEMRGRRDGEDRRDRPGTPGDIHELHRRMHHLRVAIDNLHAGGFHEPAEALEKQAHAIQEELERRSRRGSPERRERDEHHGANDNHEDDSDRRHHGPSPEIGELHRNLEQMRAQMEELHRALRELQGQLEGRERR